MEPRPAVYLPLKQVHAAAGTLLVRTDLEPTSLAPAVRKEFRALDPPLADTGEMPYAPVGHHPLDRARLQAEGQCPRLVVFMGLVNYIYDQSDRVVVHLGHDIAVLLPDPPVLGPNTKYVTPDIHLAKLARDLKAARQSKKQCVR